jgi:hypothetical protein
MIPTDRAALAALTTLITLHGVMLMALYAGVAPHPPARIPLFAMAPFLGAVFAAAGAALILGPLTTGAGRLLTLVTIVLSLVSFGPQKIVDPAFPLIWPAVVTAWIAVITLALLLSRRWHRRA